MDKVFWELGQSKRAMSFLADPLQLNAYSYVRNNPLIYVDPTGLAAEEINILVSVVVREGGTNQKNAHTRIEIASENGEFVTTLGFHDRDNANPAMESFGGEKLSVKEDGLYQDIEKNENAAGRWKDPVITKYTVTLTMSEYNEKNSLEKYVNDTYLLVEHNCAYFAGEYFEQLTGIDLFKDSYNPIDTPYQIRDGIKDLKKVEKAEKEKKEGTQKNEKSDNNK